MEQVQEGQEVPGEQGSPSGPGSHPGILTEALVGSLGRAARPGPVLVEGLAALTVGASRVVLAHTHQLPGLVRQALAGVAIAFAPAVRPQHGAAALSTVWAAAAAVGRCPGCAVCDPAAGLAVMRAAQAVLALRPPILSPRLSQPGQLGGHTEGGLC